MQRKPNTIPGSTTSLASADFEKQWTCESYLFAHCKIPKGKM